MPRERTRIHTHAHCRNCAPQKPVNQSPEQWGRIACGLTDTGLEVWCKRCRMVIAHFTPDELRQFVDHPPSCECCPGGRHSRDQPPPRTVN